MARYHHKPPQDPAYVTEWVGKRVRWYDHPRHRAGLVLEAAVHMVDRHPELMLRIARDDGFIAIGVDARQCSREEPC